MARKVYFKSGTLKRKIKSGKVIQGKAYSIYVGRTVWRKLPMRYPLYNWKDAKAFINKMKQKNPGLKILATKKA